MADKSWKRDERTVADMLGGKRVALSGGRGAHSRADVLVPGWFIEVKRRAFYRGAAWLQTARVKAAREDRRGALVVHVANSREWLVVVSLEDFEQLLRYPLRGQLEADSGKEGEREAA